MPASPHLDAFAADRPLRLLFSGGGSGGHLYPAVSVIEELTHLGVPVDVGFLNSGRDIDRRILLDHCGRHTIVEMPHSGDLRRQPIRSVSRLRKAFRSACRLLRETRPDCVIGCGGFASVPGVLAARWCRVPIVLLEQNFVPGRATSFLSRFCCAICVTFPETLDMLPQRACGVWTGNPTRRQIQRLATSRPASGFADRQLLILGGSQGARAFNMAMADLAKNSPDLFRGWRLKHQTGSQDADLMRDCYTQHRLSAEVTPFIDDMPQAYAASSLIISRAGGTTLAELANAGLPAVLIPYPGSIRDHQLQNAEWYRRRDAAVIVEESNDAEGFVQRLRCELETLLPDSERCLQMATAMKQAARPRAAEHVVDVILRTIAKNP